MRKTFKKVALELAEEDKTPVMVFGDISVYLFKEFADKYPDRFYNMGICESTLVSVAAGLSAQGFCPFVHSIAPFIVERAYEQIKLDFSYNRFSGNLLTCGASFDYAWDGATHHCYNDLELLRVLPGAEVIQAGSNYEFETLLRSQYGNDRLSYFKMSDFPHEEKIDVEFGKANVLKDDCAPVTVMTAGPILGNVLKACEGLPVNLVYFTTIKPIDHEVIQRFRDTKIVVVHDSRGLYEAIQEVDFVQAVYHGVPDQFCVWYGRVDDIRQKISLDPKGIRQKLLSVIDAERKDLNVKPKVAV